MKMTRILQAAGLFVILIIMVSCRSSRPTGKTYPRGYPTDPYPDNPRREYPVYRGSDPNPQNLPPGQAKKIYGGKSAKVYAPGQRKKYGYRQYPLVIRRTPGIIIRRANDGRYYYRNQAGLTYWSGYDDRLYLDPKHVREIDYDQGEYDDWKHKGKSVKPYVNRGNDHGGWNKNGKAKGKSRY